MKKTDNNSYKITIQFLGYYKNVDKKLIKSKKL